MSDWKKRATPVPAADVPVAPEGGADWRLRAAPVETGEAEVPADYLGAGKAFGRGVGQGLTFNFGDEIGAGEQALLARVAQKWPGLGETLGIDTRYLAQDEDMQGVRAYTKARDENRAQLSRDEKEHGGAAFAGNIAGGLITAPLMPGGAAGNLSRAAQYGRAAATGAAVGSLGALGASGADLTKGEYGRAAFDSAMGGLAGAGLGVGAKGLGDLAGLGLEKGRALAEKWASRADELAEATGKRMVGQTVNSLRGEAGGAASRAGNTIKNIDEIDLTAEAGGRTAGYLRETLTQQLEAISEDIAEARARAVASGLDPEALGVGRVGEFLSKGSKLDAAQKAAAKLQAYEATAEALQQKLAALQGVADDAPVATRAAEYAQRQAALKADPRFLDAKENLLGNALDDFAPSLDDALAKRAVYSEARAGQPAAEAAMKEKLLSGAAAKERAGQLLKRYGPPLVGSLTGTALGAGMGGVVGAGAGMLAGGGLAAAAGGLAGAGMRPAVQAILRSTAYPPVLNAAAKGLGAATGNAVERAGESLGRPLLWKTAHTLATRPEVFGPFAALLAKAVGLGEDELAAEHARLSATSPDYQARMRRLAEEDEFN